MKRILTLLVLIGFLGFAVAKSNLNAQILSNSNSITYLSDQFTSLAQYVAPIETLYVMESELAFPVASMSDFQFASTGSGGAANTTGTGFGNDDGMFSMNTGTAGAGSWRSLNVQSNTGTMRTLALSTVPTRIKFQITTTGVLTNKTIWMGLGSTATISTAYQAAGANTGVGFRIVAAGAGVNYFAVTKNGASETTTDTGIADAVNASSTAQLRTFEIVATSQSIQYYICSGPNCLPTIIATHSTNIPTAAIGPALGIMSADATNNGLEARWFKYASARTNVM
jgi:hypothetical protein